MNMATKKTFLFGPDAAVSAGPNPLYATEQRVIIRATVDEPSYGKPGIVRHVRVDGASGHWRYGIEEDDAPMVSRYGPMGYTYDEPAITWCEGWQLSRA